MIFRVGDITLRVDIAGEKCLQFEREARKRFSQYLSPNSPWDASLIIHILPDVPLDDILLKEETGAIKQMLKKLENRFPFARYPYPWVAGANRRAHGRGALAVRIPRPFLSPSHLTRFSIVPLRQCLLALDHDEGRAVALLRGRDVSALNHALVLAVQAAICMLATGKKAVMLHGASAKIGGEGYLFLGVSGSGKSTVASRFPEESVYSDESSLCCLIQDRAFLVPTPFTQTIRGRKLAEPVPLKKVFFLEQDKTASTVALTPGAAMVRMLHNHIHFFSFFRDREAGLTCGTIERMVRSAPAFVLRFTRDFDPFLFFEENAYGEKKAL